MMQMMYVTQKKKYYQNILVEILKKIYDYHYISLTGKQFLIRYLQYQLDQREQQLTGVQKENYYELQSFFSNLEMKRFFPKQHWTLVFTNTFIKSLCEISEDDTLLILVLLNYLIKGKFFNYKPKLFQLQKYYSNNPKFPFIYNYLFGTIQESYLSIAIQIIPNQYPVFDKNGQIERFEFIHDIVLINIVPANSKNPILYYELEQYFRAQFTAPDFFQKMKIIIEDKDYEYKATQGVKIGEKSDLLQFKVLPKKFKPLILQGNDEYVFDQRMQKWIVKQSQELYNKKFENLQEFTNNYYLIQKYCINPSTYYLEKIVENIPNFRVKLTTEQLEAISHSGDTLVIGRSGTGKTTCALLKLFATDTLFKLRMKLDLNKNNYNQISLNSNQGELQLKTIFVTASPVLACQVKRLYHKLVNDIQESLNQKKLQKAKQQSEQLNDLDQSCFEVIEAIKQDPTQVIQENNNQNNNQYDDDLEENEIDEYEKEMGSFQTFQDLKQFPVFLTLRKLLFLIDSSLMNSFFKLRGGDTNKMAQWHNEQLGIMQLNNTSGDLEERQEKINQKLMNQIDNDYFFDNNIQEVTQDIFVRQFWPKIKIKMAEQQQKVDYMDPTFVWGEICTKIKGSEHAHKNFDKFLNYSSYQNIQGKPQYQAQLLYESFLIYEQLKNQQGYYDLLDMVNHINYELTHGSDIVEKVHFLILDELQDMPRAVLILLDQITQNGLFCCGDNAQNIAKGIEYKFFQVQKCIQSFRHDKKKQAQNFQIFDLNINFRSHNKILQLANSVIKILEMFYPQKIDKLKKEVSNIKGPKPILINSSDISQLLYNVDGLFKNEKNITEFGCNQVILVKDQESKGRIPVELQNAIVLTIYEAKGLEFDDVILFNFFYDSTTPISEWQSLKEIDVQTITRNAEHTEKYFQQNQSEIIATKTQKSQGIVEIKQLKLSKLAQQRHQYEYSSDLCQELKLLYVAITRPRKRLIIFDEPNDKRKLIQNLWSDLGVVKLVNPVILNNQVQFHLEISNGNSINWKRQGLKMFRLKCFHSAVKCFKFAGDELMEKKSKAYSLVLENINHTKNYSAFNEAGQIFEQLELHLRAAQCFFTGKQYQRAYDNYAKLNLKNEMAEAAYFSQNFEQAAQIFCDLNEIRRAIECYSQIQQWEKIILLINQNRSMFTNAERMAFLNNYFPQFLENIINEIENEDNNIQVIQEDTQSQNNDTQSFCVQKSLIDNTNENIEIIDLQSQSEEIVQIDLDQSESFQVQDDQSVDHLSFYDPDDQWLQIKGKSFVKSISSKISQSSEFSNLLLIQNPTNFSLLKQKKNIFISSNSLQKIIEKFSLFSQEFQEHLKLSKSRAVQLSNRDETEKESDHIVNFIYDFDNIDIETIYLILDMLEQFKSYKLCLYVCNQYKLANLLGRYLVSLAAQYSPFLRNKMVVCSQLVSNSYLRKSYLEQSAISQIAINNIFDSINPIFLKFKYSESLTNNNSLGLYCYKNLIDFGFWKMVIFQLNQEYAINLCLSFGDYGSLFQIYDMIKEKRNLDNNENYQRQKYKYFHELMLLKANSSHSLDLDDTFIITKQYFLQKDNLDIGIIEKIIENGNMNNKSLSFQQKLLQIESIYLSYQILCSKQQFDIEYLIKLFQLLDTIHKKIFSSFKQDETTQTLLFCYGCSMPQGELMNYYSQYALIHISSNIMKNLKEQKYDFLPKSNKKLTDLNYCFIDVALEYIIIPIEDIIKQFQYSFVSIIQSWIYLQSINLSQQYQFEDYEQSFYLVQEDKENFLIKLLILFILEEKERDFSINIKKKAIVQQKLIKIFNKYIENSIENQEQSIFDTEDSYILNFISRIILKNNFVLSNTSQFIKYQIRDICYKLINQGKKKDHSIIIKVINLLNLTNQLEEAIFIIETFSNKSEYFEPYLKYIEFLECFNNNFLEDMIGCYLDFVNQIENRIFPDEQFYQIINIGIRIILSISHSHNVQTVLTVNFLDYLNNFQMENDETILFQQNIYSLQNDELLQEYLLNLTQFLKFNCSQYFKSQIQIFLISFAANLLNCDNKKIKLFLDCISNFEKKIDQYFQIKELLLNKSKIKQSSRNFILKLTGMSEDQLVLVQICKNETQEHLIQQYEQDLQEWDNQIQKSQKKIQNGKVLIRFCKKLWIKNQNVSISDLRHFAYLQQVQTNPKEFQDWFSKNISKALVNIFQKAQQLMKQMLEAKRNLLNSTDIHFISKLQQELSFIMTNFQVELQYKQQSLEKIEKGFNSWLDHQSFEHIQKLLLDKNRQILAEKWKNLTAGVKLKTAQGFGQQKQFEKKQLQVILESNEI